MSRQQNEPDGSSDAVTAAVPTTRAAAVAPAAVPEEIRSITRALASEQPPTNPLDVLKAARWWYIHGQGGTDPVFQWAIEWTHHLATDTPGDVARFDAFLEYLVALGFAEEKAALR